MSRSTYSNVTAEYANTVDFSSYSDRPRPLKRRVPRTCPWCRAYAEDMTCINCCAPVGVLPSGDLR